MKTKAEIAFDYIAGLRAGVEQDIAELDKRWPMYKRGANANRASTAALWLWCRRHDVSILITGVCALGR